MPLAELGRGGFGAVLRAFDRKLGREVALKVIVQLDPEEVARFREEARALTRVHDPGVVRILDVDEREGRLCLVMDLVQGETLQARLGRGPLEPREVTRLGTEIARILEHLHGTGVVHRDLKPANVMIQPDGRPVLLDLGLALLLDRSARLSRSGEAMGTPAYMAPEQAQGRTRDMGPAADVYGLGATLFALLTGRPPFEAGSAVATMDAVVHQTPPAPSSVRPGLGTGLDRILLACLAKDPLARPDLRQVRAALQAADRGAPAAAGRGALRPAVALALLGLVGAGGVVARRALAPEGPPALVEASGLPVDPRLAADRRVAEAGDAAAMARLGDRLRAAGPDRDVVAADRWYRRAAEAGSADAMIALGNSAWDGNGVPRDPVAAAEWYRRAAEAGASEGMASLGALYIKGEGVAPDPAEAERWLKRAAEKGNGRAMCSLGALYDDGAPGFSADEAQALVWYRKSAEAGWAQAMLILANRSFDGQGVPRSDEEGARWLQRAAQAGLARAATRLAALYERGVGVPRDSAAAARVRVRAVELFRAEAEAGSVPAMVDLGHVLFTGRRTPSDLADAARWWKRALSFGDARAAYWLAVLAYDGAGVERDLPRAQELFRLADSHTRDYAALYLYLIALEQGDEPAGLAALRAARGQARGTAAELIAALLDERSEEELLGASLVASDGKSATQRRCLGSFFLGARHLLRGDRARGEELLRACVATGVTEYPQHGSARAMLARIGAGEGGEAPGGR